MSNLPQHPSSHLAAQPRGALFRLTLESYGYTFVAKGTVRAFKAKLKHEGVVYQHLNEVQGQLVPVYLGSISLACPVYWVLP